jgi:hypothetical protein
VSPHIGGLEVVVLVPFDIAAVDTADRNDLSRPKMLIVVNHARAVPDDSGY